MQDNSRAQDGRDRLCIDIHAGAHRTEQRHCAVPGDKAGRGRAQTEEQQIAQMQRLCPWRKACGKTLDTRRHQQKQQPVGENAAGQRDRAVAHLPKPPHQHGIHAPYQRRAHAEQRTHRTEMQLGHPGERHQCHTRHCAHKSAKKPAAEFFPQHRRRAQRGKQRRRRNDHADERRRDIGQRDILHQKIQRHAGQSRQCEQNFMYGLLGLQPAVPDEQQHEKTQPEARDHDLQRRKGAQQHLGRYKGQPPYRYGKQAAQMPLQSVFLHILHAFLPLTARIQ